MSEIWLMMCLLTMAQGTRDPGAAAESSPRVILDDRCDQSLKRAGEQVIVQLRNQRSRHATEDTPV